MIGSWCGKRLVVNQLGSHWNVRAGKNHSTTVAHARPHPKTMKIHQPLRTPRYTKNHHFNFRVPSWAFVPFVVDAFGRTAYFQDRHRENNNKTENP